jgi:hypothetical protein
MQHQKPHPRRPLVKIRRRRKNQILRSRLITS